MNDWKSVYIWSIKTETEMERERWGRKRQRERSGERRQKRKLNSSKDKEDTSEKSYLIQSWIVTSRQLHRVTSGLLSLDVNFCQLYCFGWNEINETIYA